MTSSLLPKCLARLSGAPVHPLSLTELESLVTRGLPGVVATHSSEVGRFCAYWVPANEQCVFRVSSPHAVRSRLKRLVRQHPGARMLATGEVL